MVKMTQIAAIAMALVLSGCAGFIRHIPSPGDPVSVVTAKMGQPTAVYPEGAGQELEFATGPYGQFTWMAHIGPDGRMVSIEQVLTGEKFATIKVDKSTKADVLRTIGHPAETSRVALHDYEVWTYRYKESGVWDSVMYVHFDHNGIVRMMLNGPDPLYDERFRDGHG
jgi:hypothetical protein